MPISNAFPQDRVARGLAIKTEYEAPTLNTPKGRPVKIVVYGIPQESVSVASTPFEHVSLSDSASRVGRKSTIYHTLKMLKPQFGLGVGSIPIIVFPLTVTTGGQAAGSITPTGSVTAGSSQTYTIKENNQVVGEVTMTGATGAATVADFCDLATTAINAKLDAQCAAVDGTTAVNLTVGYETDAGDFVHYEIESPTDAELTFVIVQPTGGAGSIDLDTVWAIFGDNWHSHVVNATGDATTSATLNAASTFGEARWAPTVHKPFKHYTGSNEATAATIRAITDARTTDRTNSIKWTPDSNDLPWTIAGRMVAQLALTSNADPAQDAQLRKCDLLTVGADAYQLNTDGRDLAVKDGLSTIEVIDNSVYISDSVMCYHPAGEDPPAWRKDVAIEKECAVIYNVDTIFSNPADAGNPLAQDGKTVTNPNARKPSYFKQKIDSLFDALEAAAIISDAENAKEQSSVEISGSNPDRLDVTLVYDLTGNNSVNSVNNKFSYYVGGA